MSSIEPVTFSPVVLELSGELDVTAAPAIGAALSAAVSRLPVIKVDLLPRRPWPAEALPFWTMTWNVAGPVR